MPESAQGQQGRGHPAQRLPCPLLGRGPGPGAAAAVRGRTRRPVGGREAGHRRRRAAAEAAQPDARRRHAAQGRRIGAQPGRHDDLQQLRQAPRQRRFTFRAGRHRRRHRHPHGPAGHGRPELLPGPGQSGRQEPGGGQRKRHHATGGPAGQAAPPRRRWARPAAWLPDGSALLVTADDDGASPVFRIGVAGDPDGAAQVLRLTADAAAYTDVVVAPDGRSAYALRSSYEFPAEPVQIDLASGDVVRLPAPAERPRFKGALERVETTAADGARVPAYLALPEGASAADPAPLLLWIHGGPLGSWNSWTWRWNPWLLVARGYAVLLPDPALSTGYGQDYIQRGW